MCVVVAHILFRDKPKYKIIICLCCRMWCRLLSARLSHAVHVCTMFRTVPVHILKLLQQATVAYCSPAVHRSPPLRIGKRES